MSGRPTGFGIATGRRKVLSSAEVAARVTIQHAEGLQRAAAAVDMPLYLC